MESLLEMDILLSYNRRQICMVEIEKEWHILRTNIRLKFGRYTVFFMISETQRLTGITSLLRNGLHILLLDMENCSLDNCMYELDAIQDMYGLGDIFISSDMKNSFRCWCFTQMSFRQMIHVMSDQALFHLDENFFEWTTRHGKATLRLSNKLNREPQKIVAVLTSHTEKVPDELESVIYDTGTDKDRREINWV